MISIEKLLHQIKHSPSSVEFDEVIAAIDAHYAFTPTAFRNGVLQNNAGENNGSCKIFAFAKLQALTEEQTLACFGQFYRDDVLKHPDGVDHQNIRNFLITGWEGIRFSGNALA